MEVRGECGGERIVETQDISVLTIVPCLINMVSRVFLEGEDQI